MNRVITFKTTLVGCAYVVRTWEAYVIGMVSGTLTLLSMLILERSTLIDDPCAAFAVHGVGGFWGVIATGMFAEIKLAPKGFIKHDGLQSGKLI